MRSAGYNKRFDRIRQISEKPYFIGISHKKIAVLGLHEIAAPIQSRLLTLKRNKAAAIGHCTGPIFESLTIQFELAPETSKLVFDIGLSKVYQSINYKLE